MRSVIVRAICLTALWLGVDVVAMAQDGYHQLTLNDFRGAPRYSADNVVAHTSCTIDFHYEVTHESYDDYRLTFNVRLLLNRDRSWLDRRRIASAKILENVLKHEQGHYIIAYMEQQEVLREAARTRFGADYRRQAAALFDRIHNKYQTLNYNYDLDTHHMLDDTQQHSWDVYFQKRLMYMPPVEIARN